MKPIVLGYLLIFLSFNFALAQDEPCPCCSDEHNAFDFWIGEWVVTNTNGTGAGSSVISEIEDGCIIKENWTSAQAGYTGTSYNFFNTTLKRWEQLWIDNQGQHLKLYGQKIDNQMILKSDEFEDQNGELLTNRITWTSNNDGTVRQLWEVLQGGKVSKILFDGLYKKVK